MWEFCGKAQFPQVSLKATWKLCLSIQLSYQEIIPLTQDANWMYIRRSEDALDVFWTSYVRSIYLVCLRVGEITLFFSVHVKHRIRTLADIYLFKVSTKKSMWNPTSRYHWRQHCSSGVFFVNFEQIWDK